jgi:hypothetical protein
MRRPYLGRTGRTVCHRSVAGAVLVLLYAGAGACSASSSATPSPSASSPGRPVATPDPCTVLTYIQVQADYARSGAAANVDLTVPTHKSDFDPSRDETGAQLLCTWSAPPKNNLSGATISYPFLEVIVGPVSGYAAEGCTTSVDGIGQAACIDSLGGVAVKNGSFEIDVKDGASAKPDVAVERLLATDALTGLPG